MNVSTRSTAGLAAGLCLLATVTIPRPSLAQTAVRPAPALPHIDVLAALQVPPHTVDPGPTERSLWEHRVVNAREDRLQASILLGFGVGSVAGGAYAALAGHEDNRLLSASLNTVAWGVINGLIGAKWLAGTYAEESAALRERGLASDERERAWREAIERSNAQARSLLINALLDVVYVGGGAALWFAADNVSGFGAQDFWAGVGIGALTQGAFLLGFDTIGYFAARHRTERLRHTLPPP